MSTERLRRTNEHAKKRHAYAQNVANIFASEERITRFLLCGGTARQTADQRSDTDVFVVVATEDDIYPILERVQRVASAISPFPAPWHQSWDDRSGVFDIFIAEETMYLNPPDDEIGDHIRSLKEGAVALLSRRKTK